MKVSKQNAFTFLNIISEKFVVKLFSTNFEISVIKLNLFFSDLSALQNSSSVPKVKTHCKAF